MYIPAETLDDLLRRVLEKLLKSNNRIHPTKGPATEMSGVLLKIRQPRARLSRTETKGTLFSCLGELLWYLAKANDLDFISYYIPDYGLNSDDGRTVHGAYGPRLFNMQGHDQVKNVIDLLRRKKDSRQAVIQLFDAADISKPTKDVPCTCTLQFMVRRNQLNLITHMRSNDAFLGLPHDVFAFTMLQEIIARTLGLELGSYKHAVGSLHLYDQDRVKAERYLREGWQSSIAMPPLPFGDPWESISHLLEAERAIRSGNRVKLRSPKVESFWSDIIQLLVIFKYCKTGRNDKIQTLRKRMTSSVYDPYIKKRQSRTASSKRVVQQPLPGLLQ